MKVSNRIFNNPDAGTYYHRKSVLVLDTISTTLPQNSIVDSVNLTLHNRALFTNLSDANHNNRIHEVRKVDGVLRFVLAADGRLPNGDSSEGDIVFIQQSTHAEQLWGFENNIWSKLDIDITDDEGIPSGSSFDPSSVASDVLPDSDNTRKLGDASFRWSEVNASQGNFHSLYDDNPSLALDLNSRALVSNDGATPMLTWFGTLDAAGNQLNSLADPTQAQSAATKAYVDGHTPTGPTNTLSYFNNTGHLASNTEAIWVASTNSERIGPGDITSNGTGSKAFGDASDGSISSTSTGSLSHGGTANSGNLSAVAPGAHAHGVAGESGLYGGQIIASGFGAEAAGRASESSFTGGNTKIRATGHGSDARGEANQGRKIEATNSGSKASGITETGNISASGKAAIAHGDNNSVTSDYGSGFGIGQNVNSYGAFVVGRFANASGTPGSWVPSEVVFVVGNGVDNSNRNNAFEVLKDGTVRVNGALLSVTNKKETITLSSTNITNQYIDLVNVAKIDSIDFLIRSGGTQMEGSSYEYSISYTGGVSGKTRITFLNDIATGGPSALIAGDIIVLKYQY